MPVFNGMDADKNICFAQDYCWRLSFSNSMMKILEIYFNNKNYQNP